MTRTGKAGIAQVDTSGLVAAAFDHPDSRSGDSEPAHARRGVREGARPGRAWRALDMRALHAMAVSASETYNTAVEDELRTRLGVRFTERAAGRGKRPVREIDGMPAELLRLFSSRRAQVETGYEQALARYRDVHGHDAPLNGAVPAGSGGDPGGPARQGPTPLLGGCMPGLVGASKESALRVALSVWLVMSSGSCAGWSDTAQRPLSWRMRLRVMSWRRRQWKRWRSPAPPGPAGTSTQKCTG